MRWLTVALVVLVLPALAVAQGVKDEATIKPDVKALEQRFKVLKGRFDPGQRRYVWVLEATVSSEAPCHFDAEFQDPDDKEVTRAQVEFEDGGKRTVKGGQYRASVKYPTRKAMERVTQIVIKKSDR
jgi:hypothetical protein